MFDFKWKVCAKSFESLDDGENNMADLGQEMLC